MSFPPICVECGTECANPGIYERGSAVLRTEDGKPVCSPSCREEAEGSGSDKSGPDRYERASDTGEFTIYRPIPDVGDGSESKVLRCNECGSVDVREGAGIWGCRNCGNKLSFPVPGEGQEPWDR